MPPHDPALAREIARRHGIGDDDFEHYPAFSAIVDSVLKGARKPLAEATAIEMDQFLRLMFSPVAGRMVRTLFLERLRAERELGAPPDVAVERVAVGRIDPALSAWTDALAKRRIACTVDAALPADTLNIVDTRGSQHRVRLDVLDDRDAA